MNIRTQTLDYFNTITENIRVSFGQNSAQESEALYFFYHIPKCGGMDFYASFGGTAVAKSKTSKLAVLNGRADTDVDINSQAAEMSNFRPEQFENMLGIYASHLGDKAFKRLFPSSTYNRARKVCFIREPYSRAISDYTYTQMRTSEPVSVEGFKKFILEKDNQERISKSIHPNAESFDDILSLVSEFYIFTTLDRQSELLENLLTRHGLPNVIRDPINRTLNKYRLDDLINDASLKAEFDLLNPWDTELYNRIEALRKEPDPIECEMVSIHTLLVKPEQQEAAFNAANYLLPTAEMVQVASRTPTYKKVADFLKNFGIS